MATYVAPIGSGMGDVVVCRPVLDALISNGNDAVYLVARGPRQVGMSALIEGLSGEVREPDLKNILCAGDRYINLRDHPLQRNNDWFSREFYGRYPGITIQKMLGMICDDLSISANPFEFRPFPFEQDERSVGKVILLPSTTMKVKMLRPEFWLTLHGQLKARSLDSLMLGTIEHCQLLQQLFALGIPHLPTPDVREAVNLISSCAGVVSVDTGLMHIAVQQNIPTVAIFSEWQLYYRPRENCVPIFTQPAPDAVPYQAATDYFPCDYGNWDWFPSNFDTGSYIEFCDVGKVIEALLSRCKNGAAAPG